MGPIILMYLRKKFIFQVFLSLFICCFSACRNVEINTATDFDICFDNAIISDIYLKEIADSISYIFLQTEEQNPVGRIIQMKTSQNYIFIVDQQSDLFVFNKTGVFVAVIDKKGRGPNEYINIEDFIVSENELFIYILDSGNKRIAKFSLYGKFIGSYPIPFYHAAHISMIDKNLMCIYQSPRFSGDCANIFLTDTIFNLKVKFTYNGDAEFLRKIPYLVDTKWYSLNSKVFYKEPFESIVYQIDKNHGVKPYINLDLGKRAIPDFFFEDTKLYQSSADKFFQFSEILESEDYFFFQIFFENCNHPYFYSKVNKQLIKLENPSIINNLDSKQDFWPFYIDNQGIMYCFFYGNEKLKFLKSNDIPKNLKNQVEVSTNPIIAWVKLNHIKNLNLKNK
jgi:hypothetical protein